MNTEIFTFCESAGVNQGALSISNTFDSCRAPQFPFETMPFHLVARLRFPPAVQESNVVIKMFDPAGNRLIQEYHEKIDVSRCSTTGVATIIMGIKKLILRCAGTFNAEIWADGKKLVSLPLFVTSDVPARGTTPWVASTN